MSSRVNKQMQDKTFEKAKNYVGNNVVLKDGKLKMKKGKENEKFKKYLKKEDQASQFAKINDYVTDVLSQSHFAGATGGQIADAQSLHMFNLPHYIDQESSIVENLEKDGSLSEQEDENNTVLYGEQNEEDARQNKNNIQEFVNQD